jgi:hypothetical protein
MDPQLSAALLGAFVGAVGGGAASLAGSVIVNRLQLRRQMRIRIYDELLPQLTKHFRETPSGTRSQLYGDLPDDFQQVVKKMERASVIAGRADAGKVKELSQLVSHRNTRYMLGMATRGFEEELGADHNELRALNSEIGRVVFKLKDYFAGKIGHIKFE